MQLLRALCVDIGGDGNTHQGYVTFSRGYTYIDVENERETPQVVRSRSSSASVGPALIEGVGSVGDADGEEEEGGDDDEPVDNAE